MVIMSKKTDVGTERDFSPPFVERRIRIENGVRNGFSRRISGVSLVISPFRMQVTVAGRRIPKHIPIKIVPPLSTCCKIRESIPPGAGAMDRCVGFVESPQLNPVELGGLTRAALGSVAFELVHQ